ncbi:MAG: hypothetical protein EB018_07020 [Gammaproteobacteria bacterium]|nr:hypothetical protein [Gammaproteobacteria bacterium]
MHDVEIVGGKNASIGEMIGSLARLGVKVPGGFATTAAAYRQMLAQDGLDQRIRKALADLDVDDVVRLAKVGADIRRWILEVPLPAELERAVREGYRRFAIRIDATNFALANDDGSNREYGRADLILVGVSRSGKTPTCLYLAMQYGVFAANYPLTDDDLESSRLPAALQAHKGKLFGLRIAPPRLQQIRQERRPNSRYSSAQQVQFETRAADAIFQRNGIPVLDTTECSIEEISARILEATGVERRIRP